MVTSLVLAALASNPVPPFIAVNGYVYLAKRNGQWQQAAQFPTLKGPLTLTHIGIGQVGKQITVQKVKGSTKTDRAKLIGTSLPSGVLYFGPRAAAPRPFKQIEGEQCKEWVTRWLKQGHAVDWNVDILSAYQGDLDGDGSQEQVAWGQVRFTKVTKPPISQGLLLRAKGKTYPIHAWQMYFFQYDLVGVADIDGDGKMEFITQVKGLGSSRVTISFYDGATYRQFPHEKIYDSTDGK